MSDADANYRTINPRDDEDSRREWYRMTPLERRHVDSGFKLSHFGDVADTGRNCSIAVLGDKGSFCVTKSFEKSQ